MSDTPETDAELKRIEATYQGTSVDAVLLHFARRLERERDEAIREKMQWRDKAWTWERKSNQKIALRRELEELLGITEHVSACDEAFENGMKRMRAVISERDALRAQVAVLREACQIYRKASQQGHAAHWDRTMQGGAGCLECIRALELREKADALTAALNSTAETV